MNMEYHLTETTSQSRLMARIAWMYYINELTQKEIGQILGISRVKVNRLLQQARNAGIVEISVNTPPGMYVELEGKLRDCFSLRDAVVVTDAEPGEALYRALAGGAASWLLSRLRDGLVIAFSQGRTLSYIPQMFACEEQFNCTFAEAVGGIGNHSTRDKNYNIVSRMAELVGGQASYVYAPTVVSSSGIRDAFLNEPSIEEALNLARQADIFINGLGPVSGSCLLYIHGYLSKEGLSELQTLGAVGDICGQYFDRNGVYVPHQICERMIGPTLDDLQKAPYSVIVAGGPDKVEVIRAALCGGLMNVLITDYHTASMLLKEY
jgi:DNA-binding transcriptional regulator LsrR (DeoR family)